MRRKTHPSSAEELRDVLVDGSLGVSDSRDAAKQRQNASEPRVRFRERDVRVELTT